MKLLLVDDHILFKEGLTSLLGAQVDLTIVGTATSVADAVVEARELKPDLVLMDFNLPDGTGLDATRAILAEQPDTHIVLLTVHDEDDRLFEAIRCGAKGYLLKSVPVKDLLDYLRGVVRGEAAITREMTSRVLAKFAELEPRQTLPEKPVSGLTAREREVLKELNKGATNQQIANRLYISERTVKNHVSRILSKLNLKNRYEAANYAHRYGLDQSSDVSFH